MLDEIDYCAFNVNHDVELFEGRIKPKQKMSYPKINCFRVQLRVTHITDSDDLFKFAKEHARKNMCGQTDNKLDVLLLAYG